MIENGLIAKGLTLVELLVVLVILSILAGVAMPFAEMTVKRNKELELKRGLRGIRVAIDQFHQDWMVEKISRQDRAASEDGYPKTLEVLTEGINMADDKGGTKKYLRRIPVNPFADQSLPREEQWVRLSYHDERDTNIWGGQDVYDVRIDLERTAIDGSKYNEW